MDSSDIQQHAKKLIDAGWHTNLAVGSITNRIDHRSGLVDDAVWEAMKEQQLLRGWQPTDPQQIAPSGSW